MDENKISLRYAKALFSLAVEKNLLKEVKSDVDLISQTLRAVPGFRDVLKSPVVKTSDKAMLLKETFEKNIHQISSLFLRLLLKNKRESYLWDTLRNFQDLYRKSSGFSEAVVTSAYQLDQATVEQFKNLIRNKFKTEVDLSFNVNKEMIGGFILRVEDKQLDASVSTKLKRLKQELVKSK